MAKFKQALGVVSVQAKGCEGSEGGTVGHFGVGANRCVGLGLLGGEGSQTCCIGLGLGGANEMGILGLGGAGGGEAVRTSS